MIELPGLALRERAFDTGSLRLHVVECGPEDGRPVVLLHGFPEFWYGWRAQIGPLSAAGRRVIVPDQRGYNRSEAPSDVRAYAMPQLVADVLALIEDAGPGPVDLVGHDWGAAVAWHVAMRAPQHVRQLAILNVPHPAAMAGALRDGWRQRLRSWYILFFQLPWLPERLLGLRRASGLARLLLGSGLPGSFTETDLEHYRTAWLRPGRMRGMLGWYRAALRFPREVFLARRVQPATLILWGARDVALAPELAGESLAWCDDGRLVTFPDASHWVQHDRAAAVNQQLIEFLSSEGNHARSGG